MRHFKDGVQDISDTKRHRAHHNISLFAPDGIHRNRVLLLREANDTVAEFANNAIGWQEPHVLETSVITKTP